jgi:hypothetical protein
MTWPTTPGAAWASTWAPGWSGTAPPRPPKVQRLHAPAQGQPAACPKPAARGALVQAWPVRRACCLHGKPPRALQRPWTLPLSAPLPPSNQPHPHHRARRPSARRGHLPRGLCCAAGSVRGDLPQHAAYGACQDRAPCQREGWGWAGGRGTPVARRLRRRGAASAGAPRDSLHTQVVASCISRLASPLRRFAPHPATPRPRLPPPSARAGQASEGRMRSGRGRLGDTDGSDHAAVGRYDD